MINKLPLLIFLILTTSCISTRVAKNKHKATNKIIKYHEGISNQLEAYPELITNSTTTIVYDTITIPADTVSIEIYLQDTVYLNKLEDTYDSQGMILNSAMSTLDEVTISNYKYKIKVAEGLIRSYKAKSDSLFQRYTESARLSNQYGMITELMYEIPYKIINGKLELEVRVKPKYKVVEKSITTNNVDIRKDYWQDKKFYFTFLIPLLILLFFFGDKLQEGLTIIVSKSLALIKKIINPLV